MSQGRGTGGSGQGGHRTVKQRVRTARGRRASSTRWLERQLNDPYVQRANADGYRARSAYKLLEMNERFAFLKPGMTVADLGCAPGSWCQIAVNITGSTNDRPLVAGIDFLEMDPVPGAVFLQKDFEDDDAPEAVRAALENRPLDCVMSDMAAPTTGHRRTDHLRTSYLFELAADFAISALSPGGVFLSKVFQGGAENDVLTRLKKTFTSVSHIKPKASRAESPELYVFAGGFRGRD